MLDAGCWMLVGGYWMERSGDPASAGPRLPCLSRLSRRQFTVVLGLNLIYLCLTGMKPFCFRFTGVTPEDLSAVVLADGTGACPVAPGDGTGAPWR